MSDYNFNYLAVFRYFLKHQQGVARSSQDIPTVSKTTLVFAINNVLTRQGNYVYNYMYLIKFFFGYRAYMTDSKYTFKLGVTTESFRVHIDLNAQKSLEFLGIFMDDQLGMLSSRDLTHQYLQVSTNVHRFNIVDMSIFNDLKTNVGLFDLEHPLTFEVNVQGSETSELFKTLKFQIV